MPAVALVSGGGRGVGREIALGLARDGHAVGLLGRTPGSLTETAQACRAAGAPAALPVAADVTDWSALTVAVESVERALGPVDLLVANAGLREQRAADPWEADPADWWRVVETNLRGAFHLDRAVVPGMVARGRGRVLHIGSGMGQWPNPEWSAYAASKAALARLTDSLATALAGSGVVVLEASPGLVRTDMTETMWGPPDEQPWNPMGRIVDLARRFAAGELDALHGRFVHAARDDLDALVAAAAEIARSDARTLRLRPYAPTDPLA